MERLKGPSPFTSPRHAYDYKEFIIRDKASLDISGSEMKASKNPTISPMQCTCSGNRRFPRLTALGTTPKPPLSSSARWLKDQ
jgi:hypothetical protein